MHFGVRSKFTWVGIIATVLMSAAFACGSAPEATPAAAPAQVEATATFPPTVVPPAIATPAPAEPAESTAMSTGDVRRGGHLRVVNQDFPPKWDFSQTSTWISLFHYGGRMYNGLLQFSPRDGIEIWPDMAESWEVNSDSTVFTYHIDEDLTEWHDGTAFDVDHIIYAIDRWRNPPEGVIQPRVGGFSLVDTMEKVDDRTLRITLTEPFGDFIAESANQWHMFIPQHILESNNDSTIPKWQDVVGTGPYKIVDAKDGISVESEKNANYFRQAPDGSPYPYLDKVTSIAIFEPQARIAALRAQNADATKPNNITVTEYERIAKDFPGQVTFNVEPFVDVASIQLNNQVPPFDNIDARRAVFYGVYKQGIIDSEGAEYPYYPISWFSYIFPSLEEIVETVPGYKPENREQEQAMAKEFAEKGGLTEFDLIVVTQRTAHAELIQADMAECCDVKVNVKPQDWTSMIASVEGRRYQAATGGTAPSYGGVVPLADIMYSVDGGRNGGWDPPENYLAAWNEARTLQAGAERDALFAEMHRVMLEEWVPSVPYSAVNQNKFHWNYVHNWDLVVQEIFSNNKFEDVWIDCDAPEAGPGC